MLGDDLFIVEPAKEPIDVYLIYGHVKVALQITAIPTHKMGHAKRSILSSINDSIKGKLLSLGYSQLHISIHYKDNSNYQSWKKGVVSELICSQIEIMVKSNLHRLEFETENYDLPIFEYINKLSYVDVEKQNTVTVVRAGSYWSGELDPVKVQEIIRKKNKKLVDYKKQDEFNPHWLLLVLEGNEASDVASTKIVKSTKYQFNFDKVYLFHLVEKTVEEISKEML